MKEENQDPDFVEQDHYNIEMKEENQDPDFVDYYKIKIKEESQDPDMIDQDQCKSEIKEENHWSTDPADPRDHQKPLAAAADCDAHAESTICGAESTLTDLRDEPLPSTSSQSSPLRPRVKRSRKMLEKCASEELTNLMRSIGKTLERLASPKEHNDAISAYCRNIEHRMRKLPPHLLPHFQHEVDNCLFKYSVDQSLALQTSDRQSTHL